MPGRTLFHNMREPRWQSGPCPRRTQVPYAAPSIGQTLPDQIPCAVDLLTCFIRTRLGEQMGREFKLYGDAHKSLRQRVVNLSSDTGALRQYRVEL